MCDAGSPARAIVLKSRCPSAGAPRRPERALFTPPHLPARPHQRTAPRGLLTMCDPGACPGAQAAPASSRTPPPQQTHPGLLTTMLVQDPQCCPGHTCNKLYSALSEIES